MTVETERRNRIRAALFAYAYEVMNDSMVSDHEYDELCLRIDPAANTGDEVMDEFFRTEFFPDSGMWIYTHPRLDGIRRVHAMLRGHAEKPTPKASVPAEWDPPNPSVAKPFSTCMTGKYLWLDLSLLFDCPEGERVATVLSGGEILCLFNREFTTPSDTYHDDKIVRLPYGDWWGKMHHEGMEDNRRHAHWIETRVRRRVKGRRPGTDAISVS